jgi:hypothetical protein
MLRGQVCAGTLGCLVLWALAVPANAQEGGWRVARLSGEAWVTRAGTSASPLISDAVVGRGEKIQTSRNGRVQLVRGAETVLIAPNSVLELSDEDGGRTIVRQQAGSVSIEAEKKNVQHFEVRTPVLAAVVKGTQFTVTLRNGMADVAVSRGQVDVTSFRSGQSVLVLPGQRASASAIGRGALSIGGAGRPQAIRTGVPVTSDVRPVTVPRGGFTKPVVAPTADTAVRRAGLSSAPRISGTIGPRINVHQASKGLASAPNSQARETGRAAARGNTSLWKQQVEARDTGSSAGSAQGAMLGNSASAPGIVGGVASGAASGAAGGAGGNSGGVGNAGGVGASAVGNAVSAAATAAAGSGGAAGSAAVRAANRRNNR